MILTIDLSTCNLIDARLAYLFRCSITVKVRLTTANHYNHTEIEEIKDWRLQINFFRPIFLFFRIASFIWLIRFKLPTLLEIFQFFLSSPEFIYLEKFSFYAWYSPIQKNKTNILWVHAYLSQGKYFILRIIKIRINKTKGEPRHCTLTILTLCIDFGQFEI